MHAPRSLLFAALLLTACANGRGVFPAADTDLALKRVVLYRNGIGYFERHGDVDGDALAVKVRRDQVDDLLKSLTVIDRSTGKAVLVSGLTAIAGFGSLMLAKHRGIHSLGFVMATGIATCMIAGLAFLPALLNLLGRRKPLIERPDVDRTSPTPGQEEPR